MSEFSRLLLVARTDFSYFFRTKWLMAVLISLSLSDTVGLFTAATDTGRRIWLALREGVVQYYMTLPIRTSGLVVAYIISGGLGGVVYSSALLIIASFAVHPHNILNATISRYLPGPIATIADYNPLSLAATALRDSVFSGELLNTTLLSNLLATSLPLAALGALAYWVILRTLRLRGKP